MSLKWKHMLVMMLAMFALKAQHGAMFSQYMFNGLLINPAYAGSNNVMNLTAVNRNQWVGFDGAPRTTTFSAHSPLKNKKLNLGLLFANDQLGITKQNRIGAIFAYRLFFKSSSLSFGLQAGVNMVRNNWDHIYTTTPGDLVFTTAPTQQNLPEIMFGMYYKHEKFFAGISIPELLKAGKGDGILYKPAFLSAGYLLSISDEVKIKPSMLIKYIKNSPVELDLNANVYFKAFGLGISYRTKDAMVFMALYNINHQFSAGYAYDLAISKLGTYVRSSHEIMLKYEFGYSVHPQSPRYF